MGDMGVVVVGAIGNCVDIADAVRQSGRKLVGFLDDDPTLLNSEICGAKVLGGIDQALDFSDCLFVCGVGGPKSFYLKLSLISKTRLPREKFTTVVHPLASVSPSAYIGAGCVFLSGVSVGANASVGDHTLMLQNTVIGHDTKIGKGCSIAAGVVVSGAAYIGDECYLGAGAIVRDGINVAGRSLLGMGSVLLEGISESGTYAGNPARKLR